MTNKLEEQLADLSVENLSLKSQIEHYHEEKQIGESELDSVKEANIELINENNLLAEKNNELQEQLNAVCVHVKSMKEKLDELSPENINLKNSINKLKQDIKNSELEKQRLQKRIEKYELYSIQSLEVTVSKTKSIDNHKQIELQQSTEIRELSDHVQILQSQLNVLRSANIPEDEKMNYNRLSIQSTKSAKGYLPATMDRNKTLRVDNRATGDNNDYDHQSSVRSNLSDYLVQRYQTQQSSTPEERSPTPNANNTNDSGGYNYNVAEILQKKDERYQSLLVTQNNEYMEKIKILKESRYGLYDEIITLKNENERLQKRLTNSWEFCIEPSWFK